MRGSPEIGTFYRDGDDPRLAVELRVRAAADSPLGAAESATAVVFGTEGADPAFDEFDAWSLGSMAPTSITLASLVGSEALAIDHRPAADGLVEMDLGVGVTGAQAAELVLSWDAVSAEPDTRVTLLDLVTSAELDLTEAGTYVFDASGTASRSTDGGLSLRRTSSLSARFRLVVDAPLATAGESGPALPMLSRRRRTQRAELHRCA